MMTNKPNSYVWFSKLKLQKFIPWHIDSEIDNNRNSSINERFKIECKGRKVMTFASRQDQDKFAGFEILDDKLTEKVLVFHPSFQTNVEGWNIVENEYSDFFEFMSHEVLPTMKEWIETDDVEDHLE